MNTDNRLNAKQRRALIEIKDRIREVFSVEGFKLYGSAARGEKEPDSDIDLLVITSEVLPRTVRHGITDIVCEVNLKYGTNYSVLVVDRDSWESGLFSVTPLKSEIQKDGIEV